MVGGRKSLTTVSIYFDLFNEAAERGVSRELSYEL
jgi:hypothetical protein